MNIFKDGSYNIPKDTELPFPKFTLTSQNDAIKLDKCIDMYIGEIAYKTQDYEKSLRPEVLERLAAEKDFYSKMCLPLNEVFIKQSNNPKLLNVLLDIKLSFALTISNYLSFMATNNYRIRQPIILEDLFDYWQNFKTAFDMHNSLGTYILRYRALFDKMMAALIYKKYGEVEYDKFLKAKSKKTSFFKYFNYDESKFPNINIITLNNLIKTNRSSVTHTDLVTMTIKVLHEFDERFRTPEAHNTGRLAKYVLTKNKVSETPLIELLTWFNLLLDFVKSFTQICLE